MSRTIAVKLLPLVLAGPAVLAQEHPYISAYALTELDGAIRIDWTISGGNTCNGQDVERSTDGVTFINIHRIEGICGNAGAAVPYDWIDDAPPELSTVYYRVKLGFDGYTSVKSVFFGQLITSDQRFFPSPMNGEATLLLRVSSRAPVNVRIWNSSGVSVFERTGLDGPSIPIPLPNAPAGLYYYRADSEGRIFTWSFVRL